MQPSMFLAAALGASGILAAPTWPHIKTDASSTGGAEAVSDYFNKLAEEVQAGKYVMDAPVCDLSKAVMPMPPKPLEAPPTGLVLKHVAVGRGTQNYTCDATNATAVPQPTGAVAALFNASCVAASYPDVLHVLPGLALHFDLTDVLPGGIDAAIAATDAASVSDSEAEDDDHDHDDDEGAGPSQRIGPTNLDVSGLHFFTDDGTPFFNLDTTRQTLGSIPCTKTEGTDAPTDAPRGLQDEGAVPWLRLQAVEGATGGLQEVYRVETAGGSPPASCQGMPDAFQVQYAAEYWFYETAP